MVGDVPILLKIDFNYMRVKDELVSDDVVRLRDEEQIE